MIIKIAPISKIGQGIGKNMPNTINKATAISVMLPMSVMLMKDFANKPTGIRIEAAIGTLIPNPFDNKIAAAIKSITPKNHIILRIKYLTNGYILPQENRHQHK